MTYSRQASLLSGARMALIALGLILSNRAMRADGISVNGTCEFGVCNPVSVLSPTGSVDDSFSFVYTLANSDRYQITGIVAVGGSAISSFIGFTQDTVTATFLGNNTGTASAADTLSIDFLQAFATALSTGSGNVGNESIAGFFSGPISSSSSAEHQFFSNGGTAMALLGPFFPPNTFFASATSQPFSYGPTTSLDANFTLSFGLGSGVGSAIDIINSPVSEPPVGGLVGAAILLFLLPACRRQVVSILHK